MKSIIPNSIKHYLSEIADRLWNGHASIMIGAGFSSNARKADSTVKSFPTWNELGDIFFEKINGNKPIDSDKAYLNVLKLADEVEVAFGKEYLNNIIKREVPDKEYIPSDLHVKILSLPWKDVFTTNYDTLLERSADLIVERRYEVVTNKHDLVWSTSPRIVKLHGSFPSERPFIISGEDYRQYPKKYAPFVNTVQQSLLENTLCLIGFSGDDPNFLNWIGWIRDNLGKENSPKIYLVGILSLSAGQTKLLEERNIIPVDLSGYCSDKINHYDAIDKFINSLNELNENKEEEWGKKDLRYKTTENEDNINEVFNQWRNLRQSYPGWLILPREKRKGLIETTESIYLSKELLAKFSDPNDLLFLYEFNWRCEKSLHPLLNKWSSIYESVIEKYNPFHEKLKIEGALTKLTNEKFDWKLIKNAWIAVQLDMLRLFREEGWDTLWNKLADRFDKILSELSSEQQARYFYEKCLQYAYSFDLNKLIECLSKWPIDMSMPYWEAKRATLIAEFDSTIDAVNILELALKEVRSRLNLSPVKNNYRLISMESYIMLLHRCVSRANDMRQRLICFEHNDNFQKRWQALRLYDCDPWEELKYYELEMQSVLNYPKKIEKAISFDIGTSQTNFKFGNNKSFRLALGFFRFLEDVGLPYHLPKVNILNEECFINALTVFAQCSPFSGNVAMIRFGNYKTVNSIYNRISLSKMSKEEVTSHILQYTRLLKETYKVNQSRSERDNIIHSLSSTLPEIISRLCCKSTYEARIEILDIVKEIYISKIIDAYVNVNELIKRLIESFTAEEQYQLIPKFLEFPIYMDRTGNDKYDPFKYIVVIKGFKGIEINNKVINKLISDLLRNDSTRAIAFNRLYKLIEYDLLNLNHIKRIARNSWKFRDKYGFPAKLEYFYFGFLGLPHPDDINPENILRKYIAEETFPINSRNEDKSISFFMGDVPILRNIAGTNFYKNQYEWTPDEINLLVSNIIEWWDSDKHYLLDKGRDFGPSISDEFKSRFRQIRRIITTVISNNYDLIDSNNSSSLQRMIEEIPSYDVHNLEIKASLPELYKNYEKLKNEIIIAISSYENDIIIDGMNSIIELSNRNYDIPDLINSVTSNFRSGKKEGLGYSIRCINQILLNKKCTIMPNDFQNMELGLLYLISYTEINNGDNEYEANEKINIKRRVAELLASYNNLIPNSEACVKWKQIICDNNEFSEVINQYKNTMCKYGYN